MSHYEERLEHDLNIIQGKVRKLASLVEDAVEHSVQALVDGDVDLANAVILGDGAINRLMRETDELCHRFIAVHLPSAGHLRYISSVMRANLVLERIGDYAVTISREVHRIDSGFEKGMATNIQLLASEVQGLLKQAVVSFNERNAGLAKSAYKMASYIDNMLAGLYMGLQEDKSGWKKSEGFAIFSVYYRLERIADQAKNLCEQTVFAVLGEGKADKVYRILFIDDDNSCLSLLAESIARKLYPEDGDFSSVAGEQPAPNMSAELIDYMDAHGLEPGSVSPRENHFSPLDLNGFHVIISLQKPVKSYISNPPFSTTLLRWDLGSVLQEGVREENDFEAVHRELSVHIKDLMQLLTGKER